MKATLLVHIRERYARGIIEGVIWQVPKPVAPCEHAIKYRLVYIVDGKRLVGYDNERGKGDHKHVLGQESAYRFQDAATLLQDFMHAVREIES